MSSTYTIVAFDKTTATMSVAFPEQITYNYGAPRANGVYLTGDALEAYIQIINPAVPDSAEKTQAQNFTDDPSTITGGEEIQAKYQAYLDTVLPK